MFLFCSYALLDIVNSCQSPACHPHRRSRKLAVARPWTVCVRGYFARFAKFATPVAASGGGEPVAPLDMGSIVQFRDPFVGAGLPPPPKPPLASRRAANPL